MAREPRGRRKSLAQLEARLVALADKQRTNNDAQERWRIKMIRAMRQWLKHGAAAKRIAKTANTLRECIRKTKKDAKRVNGECTCGADRTGPSAEAHANDCPAKGGPSCLIV